MVTGPNRGLEAFGYNLSFVTGHASRAKTRPKPVRSRRSLALDHFTGHLLWPRRRATRQAGVLAAPRLHPPPPIIFPSLPPSLTPLSPFRHSHFHSREPGRHSGQFCGFVPASHSDCQARCTADNLLYITHAAVFYVTPATAFIASDPPPVDLL